MARWLARLPPDSKVGGSDCLGGRFFSPFRFLIISQRVLSSTSSLTVFVSRFSPPSAAQDWRPVRSWPCWDRHRSGCCGFDSLVLYFFHFSFVSIIWLLWLLQLLTDKPENTFRVSKVPIRWGTIKMRRFSMVVTIARKVTILRAKRKAVVRVCILLLFLLEGHSSAHHNTCGRQWWRQKALEGMRRTTTTHALKRFWCYNSLPHVFRWRNQ